MAFGPASRLGVALFEDTEQSLIPGVDGSSKAIAHLRFTQFCRQLSYTNIFNAL
ncbi:hypothetical protein [Nostoc sp.]|uniref:hypothetical protein n=1 Tax=Nostoc sp. TaxID=1180 RepID=UPI002FF5E023